MPVNDGIEYGTMTERRSFWTGFAILELVIVLCIVPLVSPWLLIVSFPLQAVMIWVALMVGVDREWPWR